MTQMKLQSRTLIFVLSTLSLGTSAILAQTQPPPAGTPAQPKPAAPPPAGAPAAPKPAGPSTQPRTTAPAPARALTLSVQVTDRSGNPVEGVAVGVEGPVEREGSTSREGTLAFRGMRAGTYRLRFEHDRFITLERELVMRAQSADVAIALSAAPPEPAAPPPAPAPAPAPPPRTPRAVDPRWLDLPDFADRNLIGGQAQRTTTIACAEGGTSRLMQVRDPLNDQQHPDEDEFLYVLAGSGVVRIRNQDVKLAPGYFLFVPRGIAHSIRREGRNPIVMLSTFAGTPCPEGTALNR